MPEQDLHSVSRLLADDGRFCSAQRMGAVILPAQSDPGHPLVNKPGILPGADVIGAINSAWKGVVPDRPRQILGLSQRLIAASTRMKSSR
jgi:hypothetical protein